MRRDHAAWTPPRRRPRMLLLGMVVALAAAAAALAWASTEPEATWPSAPPPEAAVEVLPADAGAARGEAGGALPDWAGVWDDALPGVANLDPALLDALRAASVEAAGEGVSIRIESGWRSRAYQARLLREAVSKYGSEAEAARWVATPDTSAHVSGDAVDVRPPAAARWLGEHGARHGLCRVYGNEPWHFELRPDAPASGCPPAYPDPTHDPRLQG